MESFNFIKTVSIISVFILFILILFLLTLKSNKKLSNQIFAGYLFLNLINASGYFISDVLVKIEPNLEIFRWTIILLNIPIFYLYILSLCYDNFQLKRRHFLHLIPFVFINIILFSRIYWINTSEKNYFFEHHSETIEMIIFQFTMEIQYLFYTICIFSVIKKSKEIFIENYSESDNSIFKWLFQLTVVFVISHYFETLKNLLRYTDYHQFMTLINGFLEIITLIVISWVVLKALKYPEFFRGISKSELTILEILYKVGFNSKSSFNTAFKKHTALTPTEYRNKFSKTN